MWIVLEPAFVVSCDYNSFFQLNTLHGQHKNEMEELSGDIKEGTKSQNSKDSIICKLRAEVRNQMKSIRV